MTRGRKTGGRDFPPGVSGNPGGRPAGAASVKHAYLRYLGLPLKGTDRTQADLLAETMIKAAINGDVSAAREIRQATEGDALAVNDRTFEVEFDTEAAIADLTGGPKSHSNGSGSNGHRHNGA